MEYLKTVDVFVELKGMLCHVEQGYWHITGA